MPGIYYRRWTRMYIQPAAKYYHRYGVLTPGYEPLLHLMNKQNPNPENNRFSKRMQFDRQEQINTKLINNLFRKYPDLKYESISRQKYQGDNFNSYSYAYAFISEQKKLIKAGYKTEKAFQITESKFQEKMKRKIDQSLMSKGLAVGNRARSFLTIYQQQVEYESRLKMLRTKRQVIKYEQQLKKIEQALETSQDPNEEQQHYERVFQKITLDSQSQINKPYAEEKRGELVNRLQNKFKNMFSQFYERAACQDRLEGLTDEEIKSEIMASPNKIKRQSRQLIKYLNQKGGVRIDQKGKLSISKTINKNLRLFIQRSPAVRTALLNNLLNYESLHSSQQTPPSDPIDPITEAQVKLEALKSYDSKELKSEELQKIKENKLKEYEQVIEKEVMSDSRIYKLFNSPEERMLRLQILYYESLIKNSTTQNQELEERLKKIIEDFRRLKFIMEKRHVNKIKDELAFPEHLELGNLNEIETDTEYEDLLNYLRRKMEDRRLRAIDQADDNRINEMIRDEPIPEPPVETKS